MPTYYQCVRIKYGKVEEVIAFSDNELIVQSAMLEMVDTRRGRQFAVSLSELFTKSRIEDGSTYVEVDIGRRESLQFLRFESNF